MIKDLRILTTKYSQTSYRYLLFTRLKVLPKT